jgi:hypothetical protein
LATKLNIIPWDRFWELVIVKELPRHRIPSWYTKRVFNCECSCWAIRKVFLADLTSGNTKSCWCLKIKRIKEANTKHWISNTPINNVYRGLKQRCENQKREDYRNYWGRWIKCEWKTFEDFYKDMASSYKGWLTIERINNDWNYCKENCKWATIKDQANNKRNNRFIEYKWEIKTLAQWSEYLWINRTTISERINRGCSTKEAFIILR